MISARRIDGLTPSFSPLSPSLALFTMSSVGDGAEGAAATEGEEDDVGGAEAGTAAEGVSFGGCAVGTGGATGDSKSVAELGVAAGDTSCAEEAIGGGVTVSIGAAG